MPDRFPRPDRLLEGENPRSAFPRDARHWIAVYSEMITFTDDLIARMRAQLRELPSAGRKNVMDNDLALLEGNVQRYRRRREYWYARQWSLEGLQIDEDTRVITHREASARMTKREYQLLMLLVARSPSFVSASQLLVQAWHDSRLPEETLRTYIGRVRSKLKTLGVPAEIINQPRRGYALVFAERTKGPGPDK